MINSSLKKLVFEYKVFSTKLQADELFELREFRAIFKVAPKRICRFAVLNFYLCASQLIGSSHHTC